MEDVVLGRLVTIIPQGRYIDVGAGHPILENVTYALYQRGWRGTNVEPMQNEADLLRAERPEDETVQAAVGATSGSVKLYEAPPENRGATTRNLDFVHRHEADGGAFREFESSQVTLSSLLGAHEPGSVHVVKVDVEGMEADVLEGADLATHRPWVVVVEATEPNTSTSTAHLWESFVLDAGYRCTLFDGLNRFYVRSDLDEVARILSVPANVLDNWAPSLSLELEAALLEIEALRAAAQEAETYAKALENVLADLRSETNRGKKRRSR